MNMDSFCTKSFYFFIFFCIFLMLLTYRNSAVSINNDYLKKREELLKQDDETQIGSDLKLSLKEQKVNALLVSMKNKELELATATGHNLQEQNFVFIREEIKQTDVYKFIRRMPKGVIHHIHDLSMARYEPIIKKWTYVDQCFMCLNATLKTLQFKLSNEKPMAKVTDNCLWTSVVDARSHYSSSEDFDNMLLSYLSFTRRDISELKDQSELWMKFENIFTAVDGLVMYEAAFRDYFRNGLQELVEDNVQFVELRALLRPIYFLNGTTNGGGDITLQTYMEVEKTFRVGHSQSFFGARYIYSVLRSSSKDAVRKNILKAIDMLQQYPDYFAGFDLVGREDTGHPLLYYLDELLLPENSGIQLPYMFHAGETDWQGNSVDENLFDAILLNSSRIGHGYAISKHPTLKKYAKQKEVAIELCPISNQVLGLVSDLRDHPAVVLLNDEQIITVSPDDPPIWGATGVSFDVYQTFMAMTPANAGLAVLKKLALNSINYSSLNKTSKCALMQMWQKKWEEFLDEIILQYKL